MKKLITLSTLIMTTVAPVVTVVSCKEEAETTWEDLNFSYGQMDLVEYEDEVSAFASLSSSYDPPKSQTHFAAGAYDSQWHDADLAPIGMTEHRISNRGIQISERIGRDDAYILQHMFKMLVRDSHADDDEVVVDAEGTTASINGSFGTSVMGMLGFDNVRLIKNNGESGRITYIDPVEGLATRNPVFGASPTEPVEAAYEGIFTRGAAGSFTSYLWEDFTTDTTSGDGYTLQIGIPSMPITGNVTIEDVKQRLETFFNIDLGVKVNIVIDTEEGIAMKMANRELDVSFSSAQAWATHSYTDSSYFLQNVDDAAVYTLDTMVNAEDETLTDVVPLWDHNEDMLKTIDRLERYGDLTVRNLPNDLADIDGWDTEGKSGYEEFADALTDTEHVDHEWAIAIATAKIAEFNEDELLNLEDNSLLLTGYSDSVIFSNPYHVLSENIWDWYAEDEDWTISRDEIGTIKFAYHLETDDHSYVYPEFWFARHFYI